MTTKQKRENERIMRKREKDKRKKKRNKEHDKKRWDRMKRDKEERKVNRENEKEGPLDRVGAQLHPEGLPSGDRPQGGSGTGPPRERDISQPSLPPPKTKTIIPPPKPSLPPPIPTPVPAAHFKSNSSCIFNPISQSHS